MLGFIKKVDRLGRIVIPKELRERYYLNGRVEIIMTEEGLLLRSPEFKPLDSEKKEKRS